MKTSRRSAKIKQLTEVTGNSADFLRLLAEPYTFLENGPYWRSVTQGRLFIDLYFKAKETCSFRNKGFFKNVISSFVLWFHTLLGSLES